ncbi:hypothetical protein Ocin01_13847 [Orchesella cincta]|uniref:CARD domain-containing protein n=1 Tax=Orchesella cincta TaxID=48709 RepID=A0A1D2MIK5_ORCCI|nr:hypothetical protein Ocin01_13847 [Orchesella cincta]
MASETSRGSELISRLVSKGVISNDDADMLRTIDNPSQRSKKLFAIISARTNGSVDELVRILELSSKDVALNILKNVDLKEF